jgi:hypothetical protein
MFRYERRAGLTASVASGAPSDPASAAAAAPARAIPHRFGAYSQKMLEMIDKLLDYLNESRVYAQSKQVVPECRSSPS